MMASQSFSKEYVRYESIESWLVLTILQTAIGGQLNMENFITGYPGHESEVRDALKTVLGKDKYEFFFDRVGLDQCSMEDARIDCFSSSTTSSRERMLNYWLRWA